MPGDVRQTVRREFDRLLMDEERDRDARIDDACKRDARIGELLKKRTLTMTNAYAQALSEHRAPDRDAIRAEYARIDAEIAARLNALNLPGDYLQMRYRCPVCHDLGYVGDAGRHDCECFRARLDEERRKRARLDMAGDDTFEAFNADIFSPEPLPGLGYSQRDFMLRVKKLCMAYCDEFPNNRKRSLIFTGAPGLGKTFLLNCMANQLYSRGHGAVIRVDQIQIHAQLCIRVELRLGRGQLTHIELLIVLEYRLRVIQLAAILGVPLYHLLDAVVVGLPIFLGRIQCAQVPTDGILFGVADGYACAQAADAHYKRQQKAQHPTHVLHKLPSLSFYGLQRALSAAARFARTSFPRRAGRKLRHDYRTALCAQYSRLGL